MIPIIRVVAIFHLFAIHSSNAFNENYICGINENSIVCCSGYKMDLNGDCTIPICSNDCGPDGQCIRPDTCKCANGRVESYCPETEMNYNFQNTPQDQECPNNCNGFGTCNSGKCQCNPEYTGESCSQAIVGECYLNISRGVCLKLQKSLRLTMELCCGAFDMAWGDACKRCESRKCEKGFTEIDGTCQDINECQIPAICQTGKCINMRGSFRCQCLPSYQFDPAQADCVQMKKKCEQFPNLCGAGMECVSLSVYEHFCKCLNGYVRAGDGKSCVQPHQVRYNLCNAYGSYLCQFGKCLPDGYNYKCQCNPGYIASSDGKSCKKSVDYCSLYSTFLCLNGKCVSLINDYVCQCNPGYTLSHDRKKCTSICDLYPTALCPNGQCIPQENNGYECRCKDGYAAIGKGKQCRQIMNDQMSGIGSNLNDDSSTSTKFDTDFCAYSYYSSQCRGGRCINMKNNYYCECLPGFSIDKNGQACKQKDVVKQAPMNDASININARSYCDKFGSFLCAKGRCVESGSSYQCKCNSGYQQTTDGKNCYDINECTTNPLICNQGTCTNSPGSYQCSCFDGFTIHYVPGGPQCYDRNECEEDKSLCKNGVCVNTWGSFKCECHAGYLVSTQKQHCIPVQTTKDISHEEKSRRICEKCTFSCHLSNNTNWQCSCPSDLKLVLNTGLCAPMKDVVDIQFDTPTNNPSQTHQTTTNDKSIFFELSKNANSENFRSKVISQLKNISLNNCTISNRVEERPGVLCTYHIIP